MRLKSRNIIWIHIWRLSTDYYLDLKWRSKIQIQFQTISCFFFIITVPSFKMVFCSTVLFAFAAHKLHFGQQIFFWAKAFWICCRVLLTLHSALVSIGLWSFFNSEKIDRMASLQFLYFVFPWKLLNVFMPVVEVLVKEEVSKCMFN